MLVDLDGAPVTCGAAIEANIDNPVIAVFSSIAADRESDEPLFRLSGLGDR